MFLYRTTSNRDFEIKKSLEIESLLFLTKDIIKKKAFDTFLHNSINNLGPMLTKAASKGEKYAHFINVNKCSSYVYGEKLYHISDLIQSLGTDYLDNYVKIQLNGYGYKIRKEYKKKKGTYKVILIWK